MPADGMQTVEKLDLVKFIDEFPQDFFAQVLASFLAVKEEHSEQDLLLFGSHLRHKELEIIHKELGII